MSDRPNVPLPDEYAAIRDQIDALEARKEAIRKLLIADPSARTGKDWAVEVKQITTNRPDMKALREMYPKEVEEHTYPNTYIQVTPLRITEDGELVRARKMQKEQAA